MSILDDVIERSKGKSSRVEDTAVIYGGTMAKVLVDKEEYNGYTYSITYTGKYPVLTIHNNIKLSVHAGKSVLNLPDRNGKIRKIRRDFSDMTYAYNAPTDFIRGSHPGHKYTIDEMKADAEAFITAVDRDESNKEMNPIIDE